MSTANDTKAKVQQLADQAANHPLVQQASATTQKQLNLLDRELAKFGFLNDFESRTKVPKTYGVLGTVFLVGIITVFNLFGLGQIVSTLIAWLLPAYLSCAALESPSSGDDKQWLTYWIVFGTLNFLESIALRVILYYIPMYFTLKIFFVLWLMLPATRGAEKVYYTALRPLFRAGKSKANQYSSSTSAFPTAAHTRTDSSVGYSSATDSSKNPFVSTSGPASGVDADLHTTSAGSTGTIGEGVVPPAAGIPLPDTPSRI